MFVQQVSLISIWLINVTSGTKKELEHAKLMLKDLESL
jgi:hypothetical protein